MRLRALLVSAGIAIAMVIVGCGDGDDEGSVSETAAKPTGANQILFPSDCQNGYTEEPASVVVTCADSGVQVKDIQWQAWGAETAIGNGTAIVNACNPDCASGTAEEYPEAELRLTVIKSCDSDQRYTQLELTFGAQVPPGSGKTVRESFPCS